LSVREVEKPSAPARIASAVSARICATSASVASSSRAARSPITKTRSAPCGSWAPRSMSRGRASSVSRYWPNDSHDQARPSSSAQLHEPGFFALLHRCETDTTVTDHDGGDSVATRRIEHGVPADLTVVVRVHVDKTGGDDVSSRIDDFVCLTIDMRFDGDDLAVSYSDVCCERRTSGSVDHGSTANDEIEHASPRNAVPPTGVGYGANLMVRSTRGVSRGHKTSSNQRLPAAVADRVTCAVMVPAPRDTTKVVPTPVAMTRPARRTRTVDDVGATVTTSRVPLRFTLTTRCARYAGGVADLTTVGSDVTVTAVDDIADASDVVPTSWSSAGGATITGAVVGGEVAAGKVVGGVELGGSTGRSSTSWSGEVTVSLFGEGSSRSSPKLSSCQSSNDVADRVLDREYNNLFGVPTPGETTALTVASDTKYDVTSAGDRLAMFDSRTAAAPATCGLAIDVPDKLTKAFGAVMSAERMELPGAKMSTQAP